MPSSPTPDLARARASPGPRGAPRGARAARRRLDSPTSPARSPTTEILGEEGLALIERNADTLLQEVGHRVSRLSRGAGALQGRRLRHQGRARALSPRPRPAALRDGAVELRAARAQPRAQRRHRRRRDGVRAQLRLAVRPRSRQGPALRHDRGFPEFREARLSLALHPPFRRHRLRAGRSARQQAAFRDGLCAHALFRQAVHGLGDQARARRRIRWRCARSCSARISSPSTRSAPASSTPIRRWCGIRPCSARRRLTRAPIRPASSRRSSCRAR